MDSDAMSFQPSGGRPPSRREVLWDELEQLHTQLRMPAPTATLTIEDLEAEVERLRVLVVAQHKAE